MITGVAVSNSNILFVLDMFIENLEKCENRKRFDKIVVMSVTDSMPKITGFIAKKSGKIKHVKLPNDSRYITWTSFMKLRSEVPFVNHDCNSAAVIIYTGGTTGGSKGVVLSNYNICATAQQYLLCDTDMRKGQTWAQVMPLFIAYGISNSLHLALVAGNSLLVRIPMSDTMSKLCSYKPNHIMYGPIKWEELVDENKDIDLSFLIDPTSGGDALPENLEKKINQYFKAHGCDYPIMNGYGMSEIGAGVAVNFKRAYSFGSVGIPFVKNIISAFDPDNGKELKCGEVGEICVNSPSTMKGYFNNDDDTADMIKTHKDGLKWVHTGDLGYISEDGFVYIKGRMKRYFLLTHDGIQKKYLALKLNKY